MKKAAIILVVSLFTTFFIHDLLAQELIMAPKQERSEHKEYQIPLSDPSRAEADQLKTPASEKKDTDKTLQELKVTKMESDPHFKDHEVHFKAMVDGFLERHQKSSAATKSRPQFELSNKTTAQQASSAKSEEKEPVLLDNSLKEIKEGIKQRNIDLQKQIIASGSNTDRVKMGDKTGLDKVRKELAQKDSDSKPTHNIESREDYEKRRLEEYSTAQKAKVEEAKKAFQSSKPTSKIKFTSQAELKANRPNIQFEVPSGTTYDTTTLHGFPAIYITDGGEGIGSNTFTTDYIYVLVGLCYVNSGQSLIIDPGVVIKGAEFQDVPSMLIVAVGGNIYANGTPSQPIVFGAESDQMIPPATTDNLYGSYDQYTTGLWGGIAVLGDGYVNNAPGQYGLLGESTDLPFDFRLQFGGGDFEYGNSGTSLSYISIRNCGQFNGGTGYGAMNGLTLGGVTDEAFINHIEVYGSADDGFGFLGGNVNASELLVLNAGDDGFDTGLGYTGKLQFLFGMEVGDNMGEHHGFVGDTIGSGAYIYNATYIGNGDGSGSSAAKFQNYGSGHYFNSVFTDFGQGVRVEYIDTVASSWDALLAGDLQIGNNLFWNTGFGDYLSVDDPAGTFDDDIYSQGFIFNNAYDDPFFNDDFASESGYVYDTVGFSDSFYLPTEYPGAFRAGETPWYEGWSLFNAGSVSEVDIDANDHAALVAMRDALGGELFNYWLDGTSPSEWPFMDIDGNGRVVGLYLDNLNLSGDVPAEFTTLDQLQFLSIGGNQISSFPEGFGNLDNLGQIYAWSNQLNGLPSDFFDLDNIYNINVSGNNISDVSDFDGLSGLSAQLSGLDIGYNPLPEVPATVFDLVNLSSLRLEGIESGVIPAEIGNLTELYDLNIGYMGLESLPVEMGSLTNLTYFYGYGNNLTSLPDLSSSTGLRAIYLWNNMISGSISDFFVFDSLQYLDVYGNNFEGTFDGIGNLTILETIYAGENQISGFIPEEISNCTLIRDFILHDNLLEGVPTSLFELPNITYLNLDRNQIVGFPATAGTSSLQSLLMQGNQLETIPAEIGGFPGLLQLDLSLNNISGDLPTELGQNTSLQYLLLYRNSFTGNIPTEWGSLSELRVIDLSDNQLSGDVPAVMSNWINLEELIIPRNNFISLPTGTNNLEYLRRLSIEGNGMVDLPDLSGLYSLQEVIAHHNSLEFDDLEPLMQTPAYYYELYPQYVPEPELSIVSVGDSVGLDATIGGTNNFYQWYFNGNYMDGANDPILIFENFDRSVAGSYWCEISNDSVSSVTGLYLESGEKTLWLSAPIDASDSLALVDIYRSTGGQNWNYSENWLTSPAVMWEGVFINNGRVTMLDLTDKNLQYGLPPSIGELDALEWLSIWQNPNLKYLPGEFFSLSNLHYLDMDVTGITKFPEAIGLLTALDTLWIGSNQFEGDIPSEIFTLTNLKTLEMANTTFSGDLPAEIGNLTKLEALWLSNSPKMSGSIPPEIANLESLKYLNISYTPFSSGYENIAGLANLESLYLYGSPVLASYPGEYSALTNLQTLGVSDADFSAGVPDEIWGYERMKRLTIAYCQINGEAPAGLSNFDSLEYLNIGNNGITGALPTGLKVGRLNSIYLQNNYINDISVLEADTVLQTMILRNNNLEFGDLIGFQSLFESGIVVDAASMRPAATEGEQVLLDPGADYTLVSGISEDSLTYIDWYQDGYYLGSGSTVVLDSVINPYSDGGYEAYGYHDVLTPLIGLQLYSGFYDVNVVETVSESDSLALVNIYNNTSSLFGNEPANWFEGPVETWQGVYAYGGRVVGLTIYGRQAAEFPDADASQLTALEFLDVYDCDFQGATLPTGIFDLPNLYSLYIAYSNFAGEIPVEIGNASNMNFLSLRGNYLSGTVPSVLGDLEFLNGLDLGNNRLEGALPASFTDNDFYHFLLDHNYFDDLPAGLDSAIVNATTDFSLNNFDITDLVEAASYHYNDATYGIQGSARQIYFTGDPNIGGEVTLHAERRDPNEEFNWYRLDKNSSPKYFFEIGWTEYDSSFTFTVNEDFDQTMYMAIVSNNAYQNGNYGTLTHQIAVDPYTKRYATAQEAKPHTDHQALGYKPDAIVGVPDTPPSNFDGYISRHENEWYYTDKWWHNAVEPNYDTLTLYYEEDPIPINYIRLHSEFELNVWSIVLHGTGGESLSIPVNRELYVTNNQITFPKTAFAVDQVDFVVSNGSVDAMEIGDTGSDIIDIPVLSDQYTDAGEDFISFDISYRGFASAFIIERSTDGENFSYLDSINYRGWYFDPVTEQGTYYYRAKAILSAFDTSSGFSEVLETGNCTPTIPVGKIWSGESQATHQGETYYGVRETLEIQPISFNRFYINDVTAGWYDQFFGEFYDYAEFRENCDGIKRVYSGQVQFFDGVFSNDTLYIQWEDTYNGVVGESKFWAIGNSSAETGLEVPENIVANLTSSANVTITWDASGLGQTGYIIQRSVDNPTAYTTIDTVSTSSFVDTNAKDSKYYYYRVMATNGSVKTFPSEETRLRHRVPLFDPISNTITKDIRRNSYGGSWGDYDRDGDDDLYVSNSFDLATNFMYENNGNGTFKKIVGTVATSDQGQNRTAIWGDYDNDGFLDLYVPGSSGPVGTADKVYRNTGSRSFEVRNPAVSQALHSWSNSETGVWVDINNDGLLDLVKSTGFVFTNSGNGMLTLTDTLETDEGSMAHMQAYLWTVSNVDIDNDGDQDLYITSDVRNMLFKNDGSGQFTYIENTISNYGIRSRGYTWADFNNDGLVDIVTGDQYTSTLGLYVNLGNDDFGFISVDALLNTGGLSENFNVRLGRGYTTADFNNDGRVDLIWTVNNRAYLVMNQGNLKFKILREDEQAFPITSNFSHISVADMDNDGDMDIFLPNQDFNGANFVYKNNGSTNSWITVRLKGVESNSYGIGSKVWVKANGFWQNQTVVTQNGISSGNSLNCEFGLGSASMVDSIKVNWPSGLVTYAKDLTVNKKITLVEVPENAGPTVNQIDSAALVTLYDSTGGSGWTRKEGWLEGSPLTWEGTYFDENGRLVSLILNDNNLIGKIPADITLLDALEVLDLSGNALTGRLPQGLGSMVSLINVSLNGNQLQGTLPASIGNLANLENLDLYDNNFLGELPATLGGLTNLRQFELQNNGFLGFIPAEIGTLENLQVLNLELNDFEGALPEGIGNMSSLQVLRLGDNNFNNVLPAELGNLSNLIDLNVRNNLFEGVLPQALDKLTGIQTIDISGNMLRGSLAPFSLLDSVRYINAERNNFVDLGDFGKNSADTILVKNNSLDFGDFELNNTLIVNERLFVSPQDSLFARVDSLHQVGVFIEIFHTIGGSFNSYSWTQNGEPIASGIGAEVSDNFVTINNPDSPNEGEYVLTITNEYYPDITLVTRPFNLKLSSLERDKKALLEFKAAVNSGAQPFDLSSWSATSNLATDPWAGVTVQSDRVTELRLPAVIDTDLTDGDQSTYLDGNVPLSFSDLSGLRVLDLKDNYLTSFPNISNWPNIETANISNNRLAFKDLIPNVKLGTSVINYIPQRRRDITRYDTVAAGSNYTVSIPMSGTGMKYQWKFGPFIPGKAFNDNVTSIPGAISRVYTVSQIDYSKMGTYRVEVTHPDVPGLTISSRNRNVMAKTDLFGTVFADDAETFLTDGDVITYRKTPTGPFVAEDTVLLDGAGEYAFKDVVLGDFIVLSRPDRTIFPNTVPTYYEQAEFYDSAKTLQVRSKLENVDIEMVFYKEPDPDETGADFVGVVEADLEENENVDEETGGRISARRKVKRAACSIRRFTRGGRGNQDDGTYELYAYVESDDSGNFTFTDIEEGQYKLNIEYPGVPMDEDSDIFFEVGGDKENQLFTISAVITEDGIMVESKEVLFTIKPYIKDVQLYPNPTYGKLMADFLVYRKLSDLKLEVLDTRGIKILEQELSPQLGTQRVQLDLTNYGSGVYFMVFTDEAGTFRHQVKVSKN
ncbi:MAG: FG-GAP-like repeat-containing protein [Marinoscillum sp.]